MTQAGYDIKYKTIKITNKFCHYCQIKDKASQCFKFILKKDINFKNKIIVNIIYLNKKPIFHTFDIVTNFQAGRFLNSILLRIYEKFYPNAKLIVILIPQIL